MEKMTTVKLPDGRSLEFPALAGTMGPQVIDIRTLYAKSGMFTYDPGYLSTASCSSAITFIDGDAGILLYRDYPRIGRSYTASFLRRRFAVPAEEYRVNGVLVRAMDRIFLLHADHEQNASTSTVRLCGSSGANPYACIAAGIASLWGPAHGGANEAALQMLEEIGDVSKVPEFISKVKDKHSGARLM